MYVELPLALTKVRDGAVSLSVHQLLDNVANALVRTPGFAVRDGCLKYVVRRLRPVGTVDAVGRCERAVRAGRREFEKAEEACFDVAGTSS